MFVLLPSVISNSLSQIQPQSSARASHFFSPNHALWQELQRAKKEIKHLKGMRGPATEHTRPPSSLSDHPLPSFFASRHQTSETANTPATEFLPGRNLMRESYEYHYEWQIVIVTRGNRIVDPLDPICITGSCGDISNRELYASGRDITLFHSYNMFIQHSISKGDKLSHLQNRRSAYRGRQTYFWRPRCIPDCNDHDDLLGSLLAQLGVNSIPSISFGTPCRTQFLPRRPLSHPLPTWRKK